MADIAEEGDFSDIHSDISAAESVTPASSVDGLDEDSPERYHLSLQESDVKMLDEDLFGIGKEESGNQREEFWSPGTLENILEESKDDEEVVEMYMPNRPPVVISTPESATASGARLCTKGNCTLF
jgi:hypothetical protein